jgi:hypothetical protein
MSYFSRIRDKIALTDVRKPPTREEILTLNYLKRLISYLYYVEEHIELINLKSYVSSAEQSMGYVSPSRRIHTGITQLEALINSDEDLLRAHKEWEEVSSFP